MKKEWICGCGITHHLEPSEIESYVCRFGCGLKFGVQPPAPKTAETKVEATIVAEDTRSEEITH